MNAPILHRQWRSLEELESGDQISPAPRADEFPEGAAEWPANLSRRRFLQLMGGSLALAGTACTRLPRETILPYLRQPEFLTPGVPLQFATATEIGGHAYGLLVRSDEGRPTKIDGNPDHPTTLGRSTIHLQAELLELYDPARSKTVLHENRPSSWEDFLGDLLPRTAAWASAGGRGLRLLTRRINSPTLRAQIARLLARFPQARWHIHDAAFPQPALPCTIQLEHADVILSLDADLFAHREHGIPSSIALAKRRRENPDSLRFYAVESMPSVTGSNADHRRALAPAALVDFAQTLARVVAGSAQPTDAWMTALVADLRAHRGRSVIVAGDFQPASVHEAAEQMNIALGNVGLTITYQSPEPASAPLNDLVASMHAGEIETLVILGANSVFDAPADIDFATACRSVANVIHYSSHLDETAAFSRWHLPASHFLEAWSDTASGATASIVQPLIEPLYGTHSAHELLAALTGETASAYELIRAEWQHRFPGAQFEEHWRKALHDGVATTPPATSPTTKNATPAASAETPAAPGSLTLIIRPDPHLLDGRYAQNAWLQELPRPFTHLTWENAAHLSPRTATRLAIAHGEVVELHFHGRTLRAPVWILPGHADDCATIFLGHGRAGSAAGFNAFALQTADALWGGPGLEIRGTGGPHVFSTTQHHQRMEGRELVQTVHPGEAASHAEAPAVDESLFPAMPASRPAWGMAIDLASCIGCGVCTIACQAENNIPTVGREQVLRGREMHWIRVDRYFSGSAETPEMLHQPVPCMHCENAPCEVVCPVGATVHDHAGLNLMIYNRCVGTRYCSNNCPYKVRRFNFLKYNDEQSPTLKIMRNPEVTVRMRGVMEKCTYCVQRISAARITAEKEMREIRDGEVTPACAQACPADAITFGDILDPQSRVTALRSDARHYSLLAELNTRPRTTYLARSRNPHPDLA